MSATDDPLFDAIAALPAVRPDAERAARARARCHAALQRPARSLAVSLEPATVGAFCAIYAWHIVRIAVRIPLP